MSNPFELNFGHKPNNYISRLKQSEEIISNFNENNGNKVFLITGVRGSGKTVLLSHIYKHYENLKDWITVELIPSYDMLEQLASALYDSSIKNKIFSINSFGFSFHGVSFSLSGERPITNVISLIEILLDRLKKTNKRLLITIDEISSNDFSKTFSQLFQLLIRKEYPVFLLMTGLYQNIYKLQNNKDLTFLLRAPKINLEPLNITAITQSYQDLLSINKEDAFKLAKETKGFAYAYQVLGHLVYERKNPKIDDNLLSLFDQYLQEFIYDKMYTELSDNDKKVLESFHSDDTQLTSEMLKRTNMEKNIFSTYRDRLIKKGILEQVGYGKLSFSLPRFYEFIKLHTY